MPSWSRAGRHDRGTGDRGAGARRADAIMFTNTLPLTADAIAQLPASVRVGATSSVGYDHIDVAAAKARRW